MRRMKCNEVGRQKVHNHKSRYRGSSMESLPRAHVRASSALSMSTDFTQPRGRFISKAIYTLRQHRQDNLLDRTASVLLLSASGNKRSHTDSPPSDYIARRKHDKHKPPAHPCNSTSSSSQSQSTFSCHVVLFVPLVSTFILIPSISMQSIEAVPKRANILKRRKEHNQRHLSE